MGSDQRTRIHKNKKKNARNVPGPRRALPRVEDRLGENEERFRSLVKLSSVIYWEQDEQYRFISFSDTGCMAVNLSPRQFADADLLDDIAATLKESGMAAELLELELTEGMVMHNT